MTHRRRQWIPATLQSIPVVCKAVLFQRKLTNVSRGIVAIFKKKNPHLHLPSWVIWIRYILKLVYIYLNTWYQGTCYPRCVLFMAPSATEYGEWGMKLVSTIIIYHWRNHKNIGMKTYAKLFCFFFLKNCDVILFNSMSLHIDYLLQ